MSLWYEIGQLTLQASIAIVFFFGTFKALNILKEILRNLKEINGNSKRLTET